MDASEKKFDEFEELVLELDMARILFAEEEEEEEEARIVVSIKDITERKLAEEKLRESEANFRRSLDDSPLGVRIVTTEGETVYANQAILNIYGYDSIEELRTTPVKERYTPESYAGFQLRMEKRLRGEYTPPEYEISIVRKDGKVRHLQVFRKEILWNGERQFNTLYQDITERKRAEDALEKSVQLLRDTGEVAKVGGWELDLSTREVSWTEEVGRIHGVESGYKPKLEEALNFYAPESRPALEATLKKTIETGEPYDLESLFIPSGSKDKIWVRSLGRAVYSGGKIVKLVGTFQNIDKYKRAEDLLRESEARYRVLFESINDAVFVHYVEEAGVPGGFSQVNDVACKRLGYTREELLALTPRDITTPEAYERISAARGELLSSGEIIIETVHVTKDGRQIPVESNVRLFNYLGKHAAISISRDITERKRAEAALKNSLTQVRSLAVRLETIREEERTQVACMVHDELGQALTGLKLDISSIEKKLSAKDGKLPVPLILKKIQSMNALITETLPTVNRIVSHLRPAVLDDLGLEAAIEWQVKDFQERSELRCSLSSNLKDQKLDRELTTGLFRIFQEAMNNVVRHAAGATAVRILVRQKENSLIMKVSDNGRGIIENELNDSHAFGLIGMRERAALLGGAVQISGRPGKGTTVMVSIPLKKKFLAKAQSKDNKSSLSQKRKAKITASRKGEK